MDKEEFNSQDRGVQTAIALAAACAQEESHSRSEDIKSGLRYKADQGKAMLNYSRFLGYSMDDNGDLYIVKEEAAIVRLIFALYLEGNGLRKIKKYLESNGIKTVSDKDTWSISTIDRMLSNEKYVGDLITQKTYVKDFLSGKQVKNRGELLQRLFRDHHEAIIDREVFNQVQIRKQHSV